jgi:hypothetical protein
VRLFWRLANTASIFFCLSVVMLQSTLLAKRFEIMA